MRFYTCVGSRETPNHICDEMCKIGECLAGKGFRIRSGHADGADYAFERGAKKACDVYLPWATFNRNLPMLGTPIVVKQRPDLDEVVRKYHPK